MNDLPAIKDWTDVMNCVFDTLQAISKGKDLSAQCRGQRVIGKFTKHIVLLMPLHKEDTGAGKVVNKFERRIIEGKRSFAPKSLMKTIQVKMGKKEKQTTRRVKEESKGSAMRKPYEVNMAKENAA